MRLWLGGFVTVLALTTFAGAAEARSGVTTTDLAVRATPSPKSTVLAIMPAGAKVRIGPCARGWCKVSWHSQAGYARARGLAVEERRRVATGPVYDPAPELWPIDPPYPYRAGHYPKADWYYGMPPYVAISPSFYRKRFFLTAQERDRYRYRPHIFRGHRHDDDGGIIEDIDMQGISQALTETYSE